MRVTKNPDGTYVVDDAPMQLEGKAATEVLAALKQRDVTGNDAERQRFLAECSRIYRTK